MSVSTRGTRNADKRVEGYETSPGDTPKCAKIDQRKEPGMAANTKDSSPARQLEIRALAIRRARETLKLSPTEQRLSLERERALLDAAVRAGNEGGKAAFIEPLGSERAATVVVD